MAALIDDLSNLPSPQFTPADVEDFRRHEGVIEKNLAAFVAVGEALAAIRAKRYYLLDFLTFEAYAMQRWGLGRADAYRAIEAAEVMADLSPIGDAKILPLNPSQTRPLARLEPEQRQPAWEKAVELAGDEKVTAKHVEQAARIVSGDAPAVEDDQGAPPLLSGGEDHYAPVLKPKAKADPAPVAEEAKPKAEPAGDEWYTRPDHAALIREVLGPIDLDPASCKKANAIIGAARFFDKAADGRNQNWKARNVYLNPPYSEAGDWVELLVATLLAEEVEDGAILLVNANTSSAWFADLWEHAAALCFVRGRISFVSGEREESKTGWSPSVYVYFGDRPELFARVFSRIGRIVKAWDSWAEPAPEPTHWPAGVGRDEYQRWKTEQHALGVTENVNPHEFKRQRDAGL
jgi:phage N-6-adenine-methyltransferase